MKKTIACVIIGLFIVLAGCSSIQPIGDSAPAEIISGFFAGPGMQDGSWRTEYFIINSFQELTEVYSYVSDPENWYCLRYLNGSAYSDFVAVKGKYTSPLKAAYRSLQMPCVAYGLLSMVSIVPLSFPAV